MPPNSKSIVLCVENLGATVRARCPLLVVQGSRSGVLILEGKFNAACLRDAGLEIERLLDHYYLAYEVLDMASRVAEELVLFDQIAPHYEDEIDRSNNLRMIRTLLPLVASPDSHSPHILDYGCGTGLSVEMARDLRINLIGFDRSAAMRAIARRRGMRTIDRVALARIHSGSIDGMFASYVLHLAASSEDLASAARAVRPGGRVAANFHKGQRRGEVSSVLEGIGFVREALPSSVDGHNVAMWRRDSL